jgi:hypothetical protein
MSIKCCGWGAIERWVTMGFLPLLREAEERDGERRNSGNPSLRLSPRSSLAG